MTKYVVQWNYTNGPLISLNKGDVIDIDPEEADTFNRDSPGVLVVEAPESSNPPVVEGRAETGPPRDRMFRKKDVENRDVEATEAAVKLAEEHGIDLATVEGTGSGGKVLKSDVERMI